jgi:hypothetical protein
MCSELPMPPASRFTRPRKHPLVPNPPIGREQAAMRLVALYGQPTCVAKEPSRFNTGINFSASGKKRQRYLNPVRMSGYVGLFVEHWQYNRSREPMAAARRAWNAEPTPNLKNAGTRRANPA